MVVRSRMRKVGQGINKKRRLKRVEKGIWKIKGKGKPIIEIWEDFYGNLWFVAEKYQDEVGKKAELCYGYARLYAMPEFAEWGDFSLKEIKETLGKKVWKVSKENWSNINSYEEGLLIEEDED